MSKSFAIFMLLVSLSFSLKGQDTLTPNDLYTLKNKVTQNNLEKDVAKLVGFGTRHTLSDTISNTRGIGAARRWVYDSFQRISKECGDCLDVFYQKNLVKKGTNSRIFKDVWVVNVVAVLKGDSNPNSYVIISGDIDSRVTDPNNAKDDAPGANDNATGVAATLEAARVLSKYRFKNSIVFAALSGEEQGLFGGNGLAEYAQRNKWDVIGVLNNDMIGNIQGVDGVIDNREFRIFSEPTPVTEPEKARKRRRFTGGEVDGNSRQLARDVYTTTRQYMPELNPKMIYRLDRFGRGGHHRPFNDLGYAGIRIMEAHENYTQQHQDVRTQEGVQYGDLLEFVNFDYCRKLVAVNTLSLAKLASAPLAPKNVAIGGAVKPNTKLIWTKSKGATGYIIYYRETTSPTWDHSIQVGDVNEYTLEGIVIDNYFFGVAAINKSGFESVVSFPSSILR